MRSKQRRKWEKIWKKEDKPTEDEDLVVACMANVPDDDVDEIDAAEDDGSSARLQQDPTSQSD